MFISANKTDIGKVRLLNEDSLFINNNSGIFIVADGIGGHLGGEIASKIAVDVIGEDLSINLNSTDDDISSDNNYEDSLITKKMRNSILHANDRIISIGADKKLEGLGTTIVVVKCYNNFFYVANLGDSRLYLWNKNNRILKQITDDDSLVNEMVKEGKISIEESRHHSQKNIITKYLGRTPLFHYNITKIPWKNKDCLLLCSDGLTNMLDDKEIEQIIYNNFFAEDIKNSNKNNNYIHQKICDQLILQANKHGGCDNVTVVFVENIIKNQENKE